MLLELPPPRPGSRVQPDSCGVYALNPIGAVGILGSS